MNNESQELDNRFVSIYPNKSSTSKPTGISINEALRFIKMGRWAKMLSSVRNGEMSKGDLPCITWVGEFEEGNRTESGLMSFSGFAPMDFDMKDCSDEDIEIQFNLLMEDPHVYAIWKSASGKGIHALMKVKDIAHYRDHYRAIIERYPTIDEKCINVSRIFFVSHDPNMYINEYCLTFSEIIKQEELVLYSEPTIAVKTDFHKLEMVCNLYLNAKMGERNDKLLRASRLLGGFIAGGLIQEDIGLNALRGAVETRRIELGEEDYKDSLRTINNGLQHGKLSPLAEIQDDFIKIAMQEHIKEEDLTRFIQTEEEGLDFLMKFKRGEFDKGLSCGYEEMDPHFKFIKKAFTVILGHGHSGKTSFALWLLSLAARNHDWKWAVYCGENSIESTRLILCQYYIGKRVDDMTDKEIIRANKWVSNKFIIVRNEDLLEPHQILDLIEKIRSIHAIDGALIDPFNYLKIVGKERYNAVIDAYTQFRNYSLKTGINLWLTAHTNTESQREDKMPTPAHAEMGSMLYNKADQFICIHRHQYQDADGTWKSNGCQIYVAKTDRDQLYGLTKGKYKEPIEWRYTRIGFVDKHGLFPLPSHNARNIEIGF